MIKLQQKLNRKQVYQPPLQHTIYWLWACTSISPHNRPAGLSSTSVSPERGPLCPLHPTQLGSSSPHTSEEPSGKSTSVLHNLYQENIYFFNLLSNLNLSPFNISLFLLVAYILNMENKLFPSFQKHFMHKTTYLVLPFGLLFLGQISLFAPFSPHS